jgi:hypothetical protein
MILQFLQTFLTDACTFMTISTRKTSTRQMRGEGLKDTGSATIARRK